MSAAITLQTSNQKCGAAPKEMVLALAVKLPCYLVIALHALKKTDIVSGGVEMLCKDLKVVNVNITEDFYEYKGFFSLCSEKKRLDIDIAELDRGLLEKIKNEFDLEEDLNTIREIIMDKVMEGSKIESRMNEGMSYNAV